MRINLSEKMATTAGDGPGKVRIQGFHEDLPHGGRDLSAWDIFSCFLTLLVGNWIRNGIAGIQIGIVI